MRYISFNSSWFIRSNHPYISHRRGRRVSTNFGGIQHWRGKETRTGSGACSSRRTINLREQRNQSVSGQWFGGCVLRGWKGLDRSEETSSRELRQPKHHRFRKQAVEHHRWDGRSIRAGSQENNGSFDRIYTEVVVSGTETTFLGNVSAAKKQTKRNDHRGRCLVP